MTKLRLRVNGTEHEAEIPDRTLLIHALRDHLGLTGSHLGCDTGQCGACTVHLDGKAVKSCLLLAAQAEGSEILTVEGLASAEDTLHPMQEAFHREHGLQCGYCTPGMIMIAIDIVNRYRRPDAATVRAELEGNLCRCTGYHNIVKAVVLGAELMETAA